MNRAMILRLAGYLHFDDYFGVTITEKLVFRIMASSIIPLKINIL